MLIITGPVGLGKSTVSPGGVPVGHTGHRSHGHAPRFRRYRHRVIEPSGLVQVNGIGDMLLDTEGKTVQELAAGMIDSVGWTSPG